MCPGFDFLKKFDRAFEGAIDPWTRSHDTYEMAQDGNNIAVKMTRYRRGYTRFC